MSDLTPGQAAYEEWARTAQNLVSFLITPWEKLGTVSQQYWESIAQAAISQQDYRKHCEDHCICPHCL